MANPRNVIVRDGIGFRAETFKIDASTILFASTAANGSVSAGLAVGLVAGTKDMVELVTTNQAVLGRLDTVEPDGGCSVQTEGQCYLPAATGAVLTRGGRFVGGLLVAARGYIKEPDTTSAATLMPAKHRVDDITTATAIDVTLGV